MAPGASATITDDPTFSGSWPTAQFTSCATVTYGTVPSSPSATPQMQWLPDAGSYTCSQPGGTGTAINMVNTAPDLSGKWYPSQAGGGTVPIYYNVPTLAYSSGAFVAGQFMAMSTQHVNTRIPWTDLVAADQTPKDTDIRVGYVGVCNKVTDLTLTLADTTVLHDNTTNDNSACQSIDVTGNGLGSAAREFIGGFANGATTVTNNLSDYPIDLSNATGNPLMGNKIQTYTDDTAFAGQDVFNTFFIRSGSGVGFPLGASQACDVWDRTKIRLAPMTGTWSSGVSNPYFKMSVYGTPGGGLPSFNLSNATVQFGVAPTDFTSNTSSPALNCDDPAIVWASDPTTLPGGASSANVIRLSTNAALPAGQTVRVVYNTPALPSLLPGDKLTAFGEYKFGTAAWSPSSGINMETSAVAPSGFIYLTYWDRATIRPYQLGVVSDDTYNTACPIYTSNTTPCSDAAKSVIAGNDWTSTIYPRLDMPSVTAAVTAHAVKYYDVLTPGLTFKSSSETPTSVIANCNQSAHDCIGNPALRTDTGYTSLLWDMGDIPLGPSTTLPAGSPWTITVKTPTWYTSGTNFGHQVWVSTTEYPRTVNGVVMNTAAPTPNWQGIVYDQDVISVSNASFFNVAKLSLDPVVATNTTFTHQVIFANLSGSNRDSQVIDVLPYLSDGRAINDGSGATSPTNSTFAGSVQLSSLSFGLSPLVNATNTYVTSSPPAAIDRDPGNNVAVGTGNWLCTYAQVLASTAGCPTLAQVTAIRFNLPAFPSGQAQFVNVTMLGSANAPGNVYNNSAMGRAQGITLPATSENSTTRVFNGALGDRVFNDANGNGFFDTGDSGLSGVLVNVYSRGVDGLVGTADDVLAGSATTDSNGRWYVTGLNQGDYFVEIPTAVLTSGALANYAIAPGGSVSPNADANETADHNAGPIPAGGVETRAGGARSGLVTLSIGAEPTGDDPANFAATSTPVNRDVDTNLTVDMAFVARASLSGNVFHDTDNDGTFDLGESGISSVTITLTGTDIFGAAVNLTTSTSASGAWQFLNLAPGTYTVVETQPAAYLDGKDTAGSLGATTTNDRHASITLGSGVAGTAYNFGEISPGSLGDYVWYDLNHDGIADPGEPALAGVDVSIVWAGPDNTFGTADDITSSTTTDSTGHYLFDRLMPGNYRVTIDTNDIPGGSTPSFDLDGGSDAQASTTLTQGQNRTDVDFAVVGTASLGDTVWLDFNANGVMDGSEHGVAGVDVSIVWAGLDGVIGTPDDHTFTTTTDTNGNYLVDQLPAGSYTVTLDSTDFPAGTVAGFDLDAGADATTNTTLSSGQKRRDVDFALVGTGSIGDFVWYDTDTDGNQRIDEPGVAGVAMTAVWAGPNGTFGDADDQKITTTTDANGGYLVDHLPAGNYRVTGDTGTIPAGTVFGYDLDGATDGTADTTLTAGQNRRDVDFAVIGTASVGDTVWFDYNNDGVFDATEHGLSGIVVTVTWAGPNGTFGDADDQIFTDTTDTNGTWSIGNLPAGSYTTSIDQTQLPAGSQLGYDLDGANDGTATYTLSTNQNRQDVDFAVFGDGSIGDTIWYDLNHDDVLDPGEPLLDGIDVTVTWAGPNGTLGDADDLTFTTTTDTSGNYVVKGLLAGAYTVAVDTADYPAGSTPSFDLDGGADATTNTTLTSGQNRTDVDFAVVGTASLGDTVWLDFNHDGVMDATEHGVSGVDVSVVWAGLDGVIGTADDHRFTTTTDSTGNYLVDHLPAGNYTVTLDTADFPAGTTAGYDLDNGADATTNTTLTSGQNRTDVDFALIGTASLGDTVWLDFNHDDVMDATEHGLSGIDVTVTWAGPNGTLGDADDQTITTTTDSTGTYLVDHLPAGNYTVTLDTADFPAGTTAGYDLDNGADATTNTTLTSGQNRTDVDFALIGTASVGDTVWFDYNNDGVFDATEHGLSGIDVTVTWAGPNGTLGDADDQTFATTTDSNGTWTVGNLPAGSYTTNIDQTQLPAGSQLGYDLDGDSDGTAAYTLADNQNRQDVDFAIIANGSLGDTIWYDLNHNDVQDPGEPGLSGVDLSVRWAGPNGTLGDADDLTFTTTTDTSGNYLVDGLLAGSYTITVDTADYPAGAHHGYDADGGTDATTNTTLASGQNRTDIDFAVFGTASLGDTIWYDLNHNDTLDPSEPVLGGIDVAVTWAGPNGTLGDADDLTFTTTTDSNGNYLVDGLLAGTYTITVDTADYPAGATASFDLDGGADATTKTTLSVDQNRTDVDFAVVGTASMGDRVWLDTNGDGVQDSAEAGLAGVIVTALWAGLDGINGTSDDRTFTATTDADGVWMLDHLPAGEYTVTIDPATLPAGTSPTFDRDNKPDRVTPVTLTNGTQLTDVDFGEMYDAALGDTVWRDDNRDGVQGVDEPVLDGVTITAVWAGPDGTIGTPDDQTYTTTTDTNGTWHIGSLPPGTYTVSIDLATAPPGVVAGYDLDGGEDATTTVELGANTTRLDADFAVYWNYNLSIDKHTTSTDVSPGDNVDYVLEVRNDGPGSSPGKVTIDDPLPAGLTYVSGDAPQGWTCEHTDTRLTCTSDSQMNAGDSVNIAFTAHLSESITAEGNLINIASITPIMPDGTPGLPETTITDNTDDATIAVLGIQREAPPTTPADTPVPAEPKTPLAFTGTNLMFLTGAAAMVTSGGVVRVLSDRRRDKGTWR